MEKDQAHNNEDVKNERQEDRRGNSIEAKIKKEMIEEQRRNIEENELKSKQKEREKDRAGKKTKKIKKKSKKSDKDSKSKKKKSKKSKKKKKRRRHSSDDSMSSSPSLDQVLKNRSRGGFTGVLHKLDSDAMKKLDEANNMNNLTMYNPNDPGAGFGNQEAAGTEYSNIDPFIFVKLDHEASKYWDEKSAPADNAREVHELDLMSVEDPSITFLLEIITPRLPTRFYEKLPDRIRKRYTAHQTKGYSNSLVSSWKKEENSKRNNDKEFDNSYRRSKAISRGDDNTSKWYSKVKQNEQPMNRDSLGVSFSNYAAEIEKTMKHRTLESNYRGMDMTKLINTIKSRVII